MKILVTGKTGQVGYELLHSLRGRGDIIGVDRSQMDLADLDQVRDVIRTVRPDLIINPAAYTSVDLAETEPGLAMRVNGEAPGIMAEEAKRLGAGLIHYSTDYVFDGTNNLPYLETDVTNPLNVYGLSKLAGEQAIAAVEGCHLILRTSWVYGMHGKNFLRTILRLAGERNELRVVGDQYGSPTCSSTLANMTATIVDQLAAASDPESWWSSNGGLYHLTSRGSTTWAGFARQIIDNARLAAPVQVTTIKTDEYPLPARRPQYSTLSTEKFVARFGSLPDWDSALESCQRTPLSTN